MSFHDIAVSILLGIVVLSCWIGAIGAWRMREPMQGLHFCTVPAALGMVSVNIATFLACGSCGASWKALLITGILLAINSVGMHASGRAFRARELGHWEPRDGDNFEWVQPTPQETNPR